MKIAVIDLGTNGFRLYIAETFEAGKYTIIHKESNELKLAAEGIDRIGDAPFQRGIETMRHFSTVLKQHNVSKINAFATAAVRMAANGQHFIETIKKETGIEIELITGAREAELIYKGMRLGYPFPITSGQVSTEPVLMVDVGGGSVEFIICDNEKVFWAHSFNIGVAILKQKFHFHDPITPSEIAATEQFLNTQTKALLKNIKKYKPKIPLIACGTIDFLVKILTCPENIGRGGYELSYLEISSATYQDFHQKLIFSPEATLQEMPEVPNDKVEMLAVSLVLMDWVMKKLDAEKLVASANSMKAGILYEMTF